MANEPRKFPLAEGVGVFVGIVAWDILAEGRAELLRALGIAAICALAWHGVRLWRKRSDRE